MALVKVLVEFRVVVLIPTWSGVSRGCSVMFGGGAWLRDTCFLLLLEVDTCLFLSLNSTHVSACFPRFVRLGDVGRRPCFSCWVFWLVHCFGLLEVGLCCLVFVFGLLPFHKIQMKKKSKN